MKTLTTPIWLMLTCGIFLNLSAQVINEKVPV